VHDEVFGTYFFAQNFFDLQEIGVAFFVAKS